MPSIKTLKVCSSEQEIIDSLVKLTQEVYDQTVSDNFFTVGLSGGSLIDFFSKAMIKLNVDWTRWRLVFCDERCVSLDDKESTLGAYLAKLPTSVGLKKEQFIGIDVKLSGQECADDYSVKIDTFLPKSNNLPRLHLALLGMGPDGHTCSLFPGHKLLDESKEVISFIADSPKPPPQRVTMTFPVINNSANIVFVSTGASKAEVLKEIFHPSEGKPLLPAARVEPTNGKLIWIVDQPAVANLNLK